MNSQKAKRSFVSILLFLSFCIPTYGFANITGMVTIRGKITNFNREEVEIRDFEGKTWTVKRNALNKKLDENINTDRTVVVRVRFSNTTWIKTR